MVLLAHGAGSTPARQAENHLRRSFSMQSDVCMCFMRILFTWIHLQGKAWLAEKAAMHAGADAGDET
jgi:hypothetical protein